MSAHRPDHLDLCAGFVLGALNDADRREFAEHRAVGCAVCEAEIVRLEQAVGLLARSASMARPSVELRSRTLAAIAAEPRAAAALEPTTERQPARTEAGRVVRLGESRRFAFAPWAFAAAAAVLAVATIGLWRDADRLRSELRDARQHLAETEQHLLDERRWTEVLNAMDAQAVSLAPTPDGAADLRGRGTWDPATGRAVIVFEHVTAPSGRDYQLWGLHPDGPRSLGLIRPDASGRAIVKLEDAGDSATLQAFAISLEPAGGSPNPAAPSGPVVMVGKVKA